jgi:hypothetical protein
MTRKQKLQLGVAGLCVLGAVLTVQQGVVAPALGLACFIGAAVLLILALRHKAE